MSLLWNSSLYSTVTQYGNYLLIFIYVSNYLANLWAPFIIHVRSYIHVLVFSTMLANLFPAPSFYFLLFLVLCALEGQPRRTASPGLLLSSFAGGQPMGSTGEMGGQRQCPLLAAGVAGQSSRVAVFPPHVLRATGVLRNPLLFFLNPAHTSVNSGLLKVYFLSAWAPQSVEHQFQFRSWAHG